MFIAIGAVIIVIFTVLVIIAVIADKDKMVKPHLKIEEIESESAYRPLGTMPATVSSVVEIDKDISPETKTTTTIMNNFL